MGDWRLLSIPDVDPRAILRLAFDFYQSSSGTGPGQFQFSYSTNGTTFTNFGSPYTVLETDSPQPAWASGGTPSQLCTISFSVDLTTVTAINNQANVYFRLTDNSTTSASGGTVATAGTDRLDNVTVTINNPLTQYWAPNGPGGGAGGSGTWNTSLSNWSSTSNGANLTTYSSGAISVFASPSGTVTLDNSGGAVISNVGLRFDTNGYIVNGNTTSDALTLGGTGTIQVTNSADTATINAKITGVGLNKTGNGTLVLTNASSDFSSTVTISAGTLSIDSQGELGASSNGIVLSGGILKLPSADFSFDATHAFSGTGGGLDVGSAHTATINGDMNLTGVLSLPAVSSNVGESVTLLGSTKTLGGINFAGLGTLTAGSGGSDTVQMNGTITTAGTGTTTIQAGTVNFGSTGRSIVIGTGNILVIHGAVVTNFPNTGAGVAHLSVSGQGTLDMPNLLQDDSSQFINSMLIGSTSDFGANRTCSRAE